MLLAVLCVPCFATAGPPYVADDPVPTEHRHYETYLLTSGTHTEEGSAEAAGIDFNYGATPDLQLTAAIPIISNRADGVPGTTGLGNAARGLGT